ncbi:DegT/DnrJ/EryC1/StrS aminotransferase family protein [Leptolyngbya sp. FACHB-261]|uniref:DegT/DnrJ/EryC1/StrS family aminotransferase n=1 Tax=Leptolyngbya sp. FACHB-261 TaxID=2692806 RepID=UPI001689B3F5|nr:DegT/DnrJ/EryC1/StrS aminotransferase family protein [Leptolyngbya sp. FACHB-261]MBD2105024.1 DegT/DnrJ/EryC1/StrS aminotransferase family protein [Leptolyngbya sp. FACHB-261]
MAVPFVDLMPLYQQCKSEVDQAIQSVLLRGDYVLGEAVAAFEAAFAQACAGNETLYGIGVGCGTDAISLGLQACGIGKGDEVLVPANTFVATLIGVLRTGATPILVDCDPETALIDLDVAETAITPRTRAIVPVHLYGQMVSPLRLRAIAAAYDILIFEDAAQAHLAEREGIRAGSVGTAAAFSFYPSKNLGAVGDGGMVVTCDPEVARRVRSLRNYGAPRKYYHTELGTNSRLDSLQAAVLLAKLPHLHQWNQQRQLAAQIYDALLKPMTEAGVQPISNQSGNGHVYHLYVLRVQNADLDRDELSARLQAQEIQTGIHYPIPCHLQPAFTELGYSRGQFPHAEALCEQILSLPMYPGLSPEQVQQVTTAVAEAIPKARTTGMYR